MMQLINITILKHSAIKMKPIDVGDNNKRVYIAEHNEKDSRFKVGDRVRISRYKNNIC